ncbi:glycosyltransferase family 4 protein [Aestuariibaculum sp. M13]|uniref:glycosyltransferase family 4 protein n=1 Tax=Aestuariibaculum sp. M13 TaxID=2967132 RepID=UPI002159D8D1|nr:glycosyltransferase family 4 protein [Aestuariibaculum sp. M13]MCR8666353.1 glycosyltransferase family 4 protein [Aestuariibaculum sp. M13]
MSKILKIAVYSGQIPSTTFVERLVLGLSEQGHHLYLFGVKNKHLNYPNRISVLGYKNSRLCKSIYLLKYWLLLSLFKSNDKKRLDRILKNRKDNKLYTRVKCYPVLWHRPDIFHVQWAKGLADWIWVQDFGMQLVLSLRGAHINYSPITNTKLATIYRELFPQVDSFHAVSKEIAKEAIKYGASFPKIRVVYSGLPLNEWPYQEKKALNHSLKILSVGRSHWIKGYDYALDTMKVLDDQGFNYHYTIIGVENNEELLFQRYRLNLENRVSFCSKKDYEEIVTAIQAADVLLLPSLKEGLPNVVLEAMALGTLVVSTLCGGVSEVITHCESGYLVPVRDIPALAETIKLVKDLSISDYHDITRQARIVIEQNHENTHMVSGMVKLYRKKED